MSLKEDVLLISKDSLLNNAEGPALTVQTQPVRQPFRMIAPTLQILLVSIAFVLHYFRVHQILLFGVSLAGGPVPPECIVICVIIGVVGVQQIVWEIQLLKV
jgi:hypothetical protein